jgi:hypothetical protein
MLGRLATTAQSSVKSKRIGVFMGLLLSSSFFEICPPKFLKTLRQWGARIGGSGGLVLEARRVLPRRVAVNKIL